MRFWKATALLSVVAGTTVSADVILSNYPPTNDTNTTAAVNASRRKALSFAMPAGTGYDITSITLRLQNYITPGDVAVLEIRDHTGSTTAPGTTVIGSFSAPVSAAATVGDFTFTPTSVITLLPGTSYWIELHGADATTSFDWRGSSPAITPTGIATYGGQSLFTTNAGTTWTSSVTINTFRIEGAPTGGSFGACCLGAPTYSCTITSPVSCAAQSGTYAGDNVTCAQANCPPPPTGACCRNIGCTVVTQLACTTAGGTYAGNNVTCAAANCPPATAYVETGDAGDLPGTAADIVGSGSLSAIVGDCGANDTDMFKFTICDEANFSATTAGGSTWDTQLWLFNTSGIGVTFCDDATVTGGPSTLTSTFVTANGDYLIAISRYDHDAVDSTPSELWLDTPFISERAPDGPGAANAVTAWNATTVAAGPYTISLTGSCFRATGGTCYANCDQSTGTPKLTGNDFVCFINAYANNESYANCDQSTGTPALTGNDFVCFINAYAQGCS